MMHVLGTLDEEMCQLSPSLEQKVKLVNTGRRINNTNNTNFNNNTNNNNNDNNKTNDTNNTNINNFKIKDHNKETVKKNSEGGVRSTVSSISNSSEQEVYTPEDYGHPQNEDIFMVIPRGSQECLSEKEPDSLLIEKARSSVWDDSVVLDPAVSLSAASHSCSSGESSLSVAKEDEAEGAGSGSAGPGACQIVAKGRFSFSANSRLRSPASSGQSESPPSASLHMLSATGPAMKTMVHSMGVFSKTTPELTTTSKLLTPSQRFRLRREQNKAAVQDSVKNRELFYDEQERAVGSRSANPTVSSYETATNDVLDDEIADYLGWDVPVALPSINPYLASLNSSHKGSKTGGRPTLEKSRSLNFIETDMLPPCPIPGIQASSDSQFFANTSRVLSNVLMDSSRKLSQSRLRERNVSAEVLPLEFKSASDVGMEDMKLVSADKVAMCTPGRPTWLPPKRSEEREKHEKQIRKTMSIASLKQITRNRVRDEREVKDAKNKDKVTSLLERGLTRKSSLKDLKKLCWETSLSNETRLEIYRLILQSEKEKLIEKNYMDDLTKFHTIFCTIEYPHGKLQEIRTILSQLPCALYSEPPEELVYLMQLKAISSQGLLMGDELLFYHFYQTGSFTISEIWTLVNLLQLTCFNEITKEKFEQQILNPRGVVAQYLANDPAFANEFNSECLSFACWWNIMARLDHDLFMWCIDIIVAENSQAFKSNPISADMLENTDWETYRAAYVVVNHSILSSLALNVLLNYHFGFNDFQQLPQVEKSFKIIGPEVNGTDETHHAFIKKWHHYYKKF
ncbi:HBR267Wp [Eremothecium sinecaudum]|uniref:HBR267Wp n=1 Tax=Eremothecium sinecaudum TaxID=45286 RepID=A0A109UX56_9SACH|nr:HBR267Wp [Eremothecium sinecaudum]AMD19168.1 HBR267Wp [Eremothecium sinecaudum]